MDCVNILIVAGFLDRAPVVRFRDDGTCLCAGTLRLEEQGTQGTLFKTYVPFEAYGKGGEQIGEWQAGDYCTLQGKVFWRRYQTKTGEEKSGLALLAQIPALQRHLDPTVPRRGLALPHPGRFNRRSPIGITARSFSILRGSGAMRAGLRTK